MLGSLRLANWPVPFGDFRYCVVSPVVLHMLPIENFRGTAGELAEFVNAVWEADYGGKMPFPRVTAEFFEWQFRLLTDRPSPYLLAAYDGAKPAAVLLGTDYPIRTAEGVQPGSLWSWLSIAPEYRGQKLAKALDRERVRRLREAGSRLIVSYRYFGSRHSLAERRDRSSEQDKFHRNVGLWVRVLDPMRFRGWLLSPLERFLTTLARPLLRVPRYDNSKTLVRRYEEGDLGDCLRLLNTSFESLPLAFQWDESTLAHQLVGSEIVETLVVESEGRVAGLVNYHLLPFQARTIENVGCIDLIAFGTLRTSARVRLLNAALARMRERGAVFAVKVRCGDTPRWPMMRARFLAMPADSHLVLQWVGDPLSLPRKAGLHLLWR